MCLGLAFKKGLIRDLLFFNFSDEDISCRWNLFHLDMRVGRSERKEGRKEHTANNIASAARKPGAFRTGQYAIC